ncbi:MAG: metal-dependent hydrolase [Candidatus Eisenbacteria bacterium]|nr:metal-dependent hydrolase [Candidatus Eisenbacteria bacterium]
MKIFDRGFRLTWLGHSAFELVTKTGKVVLFDPWLTGNPRTPEALRAPRRGDVIALTHAHGDHVGDVVGIVGRTGCEVVCSYECSIWLAAQGVSTCLPMGKGGTQQAAGLTFTMTHAAHSSSFDAPGQPYGGGEAGYVVTLEDGFRLYHAGDTGPMADFAVIAELYAPEVALLPIGDLFTMGPREAAWAAAKLDAKWVVPMHYGTFPALTGTPEALRAELAARGCGAVVVAPQPGEPVE